MAIYFIRHGQSEFNAVFKQDGDPMIFDAPLTDLGREQALMAREAVKDLGIEQVISSPLTRAIQTAKLIFEDIAPIEVRAGHHEYLLHSCDVGRPRSALKQDFPDLMFNHLAERWWHHKTGAENEIEIEPVPHFEARIASFVKSLDGIHDRPIAFVGHGNAFQQIIGRMLNNCEIHRFK